jgi:hypothetical protein
LVSQIALAVSMNPATTATDGVTDIRPVGVQDMGVQDVRVQDESVIARDDGTVLVDFWRPGYTGRHEVVFRTSPDFCTDPGRLLEVVEAAIKKTDPKISFRVLGNENRMHAEIVVMLDTLLGVERRTTQADVTVHNDQQSALFKLQTQLEKLTTAVSGLKQDNEQLEERVRSLEEATVVVACETHSTANHRYCLGNRIWYSRLRCDELYLPASRSDQIYIFGPVVASIQASTIRLEFYQPVGPPAISNRYASTLIVEGNMPDQIELFPLLETLPNVRTVVVKVNSSKPPPTSFKTNLQYIFRAASRESCPEAWRRVADGNTNVTMEYTGAL